MKKKEDIHVIHTKIRLFYLLCVVVVPQSTVVVRQTDRGGGGKALFVSTWSRQHVVLICHFAQQQNSVRSVHSSVSFSRLPAALCPRG